MEGLENTTVTAVDQLATLYAQPSERVLRKEIDHVDAAGRAFIAASPFLILATGSNHGLDCSPKGCPEHGFLDCSCEPGDAGAAWPTATLERRAAEGREQARVTEPAARPRRKSSPWGQGAGRAKQSRTGERED